MVSIFHCHSEPLSKPKIFRAVESANDGTLTVAARSPDTRDGLYTDYGTLGHPSRTINEQSGTI